MLAKILDFKRQELTAVREQVPLVALEKKAANLPLTRDFTFALKHREKGLNLIAELKQASPSRGLIRPDFDLEGLTQSYTDSQVAAISVLTDRRFFKGRPEYLHRVRQVCDRPLLRKDFIIDPYQIYEARVLGADAILLVVAVLEEAELKEYLPLSSRLGLAALVEVHKAEEIELAIQAGAEIIGINNRDLSTFKVDLHTTLVLRPLIPSGLVVVSESGIKNKEDAALVASAGINAILVGEALVAAGDVRAKIDELKAVTSL